MSELTSPTPAYGMPQRGVTAAEVERAADALLRQGLRPTIERVRAEIGTGSPNTINPLLDAWWKKLASRLDDGPAALHRLPESVLHVAEALWMQALEAGRERARLEMKSKTQAAEFAERDRELRAHVLSLRETELEERLRTREQALEDTRQQMLALLSSVQRDQATIRARERRIAALGAEVSRYREQLTTLTARVAVQKWRSGDRKKRPAAPRLSKRKPGRIEASRRSKTIHRVQHSRR